MDRDKMVALRPKKKSPDEMTKDEIIERIRELKNLFVKGDAAYDRQYRIEHQEWQSNPIHSKEFKPNSCFALVAIKERIYRIIDEWYYLDQRLEQLQDIPEG